MASSTVLSGTAASAGVDDTEGVKAKVQSLLAELEAPPAVVGSEDERAKREAVVASTHKALVELYRSSASTALAAGDWPEAVSAARSALKFTLKVHAEGSVGIVPAYLLLAEATLGAGKHHQAQELLSMANWTVVRAGGRVPHALRAAMHRIFGKLYAAQGKLDAATAEFARDAYHGALQVGPDHVDVTGAYFHMGSIFAVQGSTQHALAFYDRVVDIWFKALSASDGAPPDLSATAQLEALHMLTAILEARLEALGEGHVAVAEARYTLALLLAWRGDAAASAQHAADALATYETAFGDDHASTADVRALQQQQAAAAAAAGATV